MLAFFKKSKLPIFGKTQLIIRKITLKHICTALGNHEDLRVFVLPSHAEQMDEAKLTSSFQNVR